MTIKELREKAGLSRMQVCGLFGIPYQTFQAWELGIRSSAPWAEKMLKSALTELINNPIENLKSENIVKMLPIGYEYAAKYVVVAPTGQIGVLLYDGNADVYQLYNGNTFYPCDQNWAKSVSEIK